MDINYKSQIIEVVNHLISSREIVFEQIVNLAMSNEYKSLNEMFEIGEDFEFSLQHFEDLEDLNVQNLVSLCKKTEKTIFTLMNLNNIDDVEVNL